LRPVGVESLPTATFHALKTALQMHHDDFAKTVGEFVASRRVGEVAMVSGWGQPIL
jgi:hypothetical protein